MLTPVTAPARTLAELEKALLRQPPQNTPFVDYRFSHLLKKAAVASGTLEYRPDGVWVRVIEKPRAERAEIVDEEIRMQRDGEPVRRVSLSRAPQLRLLLNSLRALLEGRITQMGDEFSVTMSARGESWGLRLVPRDARLARKVARIDVFGTGDAPGCIEMVEPDGDASFTLLGVAMPATLADRSALETRCRSAPLETDVR